jgi:hypothetical protein
MFDAKKYLQLAVGKTITKIETKEHDGQFIEIKIWFDDNQFILLEAGGYKGSPTDATMDFTAKLHR